MASAGTVTLELDANSVKLLRELQKAQTQTKKSAKRMEGSLTDAFDNIRKGVDTTVKAIGGIAIAAITAAAAAFRSSSQMARDIRILSQAANTTAEDFQRMAFGAQRFGIEQEKLSDILKDTTDRVGDFIQTGGGPMADFFEKIAPKVGVTADQFAKLSGKDALQLYVNSLENANLSQADMVFYMEAIASDSTRLLPLLSGNGRAMQQFANEADKLGIVLSNFDMQQLEVANEQLNVAFQVMGGIRNEIAVQLSPLVVGLANTFLEASQNAGDMSANVSAGLRGVAKAVTYVGNAFRGWRIIIAGLRVLLAEFNVFSYRVFAGTIQAIENLVNSAINGINSQIMKLNNLPFVNVDFIGLATFNSVDKFNEMINIGEASAKRFKNELEEISTAPMPTEQVDSFFDNLDMKVIEASAQMRKFMNIGPTSLSTETSTTGQSSSMTSVSSGIGGGEAAQESNFWGMWLESAEHALTSVDEMAKQTIETFTSGFGQAFEKMIFDSENLGDALTGMLDNVARTMVRAIGEMIAKWIAYQAVQLVVARTTGSLAGQQQAATAQVMSLQAGLNAFASTAAIPIVGPALAPAAMATALATTAPLANIISGMAISGMAHDGIDSVPYEGTWLLDKGERVMTADTSAKLDKKLDSIGGSAPIINVYGDAQVRRRGLDAATQREMIDIIVGQIEPGGRVHKSISNNFSVSTRTR